MPGVPEPGLPLPGLPEPGLPAPGLPAPGLPGLVAPVLALLPGPAAALLLALVTAGGGEAFPLEPEFPAAAVEVFAEDVAGTEVVLVVVADGVVVAAVAAPDVDAVVVVAAGAVAGGFCTRPSVKAS